MSAIGYQPHWLPWHITISKLSLKPLYIYKCIYTNTLDAPLFTQCCNCWHDSQSCISSTLCIRIVHAYSSSCTLCIGLGLPRNFTAFSLRILANWRGQSQTDVTVETMETLWYAHSRSFHWTLTPSEQLASLKQTWLLEQWTSSARMLASNDL